MKLSEVLRPLCKMPIDDDLRNGIADTLKTGDAPLAYVDKMSLEECRETLKVYMAENAVGRKSLDYLSKELSAQDNIIARLEESSSSAVGPSDISKLQQLVAMREQDTRSCSLPQRILSKHLRKWLQQGKPAKT